MVSSIAIEDRYFYLRLLNVFKYCYRTQIFLSVIVKRFQVLLLDTNSSISYL